MFSRNTLKHFKYLEDAGEIKIWWREDGQPHRIDGPAIVRLTGYKHEEWIQNGEYHRVDGPAVSGANAKSPYIWWWVRGERLVSWGGFQRAGGCSDEQLAFLKLKYGEAGMKV